MNDRRIARAALSALAVGLLALGAWWARDSLAPADGSASATVAPEPARAVAKLASKTGNPPLAPPPRAQQGPGNATAHVGLAPRISADRPAFTYPALPIEQRPDLARVVTEPAIEAPGRDKAVADGCRTVAGGGECADPLPNDRDRDGHLAAQDCDDLQAHVHPGAREELCNRIDEDCDGSDRCPADVDRDGAYEDNDCDDLDPKRHPLAEDVACNGVDEDCSGIDMCDGDADNVPPPLDCDDRDPKRNPYIADIPCDGIDQNCDGADCCDQDRDGDGHACRADCDDLRADTYPGAPIRPDSKVSDRNCNGKPDRNDAF